MKIKVAQPYRLIHAGTVYTEGDTADVDDHIGQEWVRQGWATEAKPTKAAPLRKRTGR
ncbi:MAG: hypothetical protein ACLP3C_17325 [Mycobacterium sp.]|uniref:hypothetical protein n=1 Tax=Mycobacterium sp. TaxID=1785 RepID=UPI003F984C44